MDDWVARALVGAGVGVGVVAPVVGRGVPVAEGPAVGCTAGSCFLVPTIRTFLDGR